jgi:hypothetical protein
MLVLMQISLKLLEVALIKMHALMLVLAMMVVWLGPSAIVALVTLHAMLLAILVRLGPSAIVALVSMHGKKAVQLCFKNVIKKTMVFWLFSRARASRECAASTQRKPRGQSPSSPPARTRPRPAAPTVRVACGSPDS